VALNTRNNDAYQVAMEGATAQNNFDQCAQNAENANSPEQYADVMARCNQAYQNAGAYVASTADTPVSWYGGGGSVAPFVGVNVPVKPAPKMAASAPAPSPGTLAPVMPAAAPGAPLLSPTFSLPTVGGFDLPSIPWWGWGLAAGAAFLAFGGARGR
jgi:hypothetical protein